MDTSYGVGVKNRYDLLGDDDDDPLDILAEAEKHKNDEVSQKNAKPVKKEIKPKPKEMPKEKVQPVKREAERTDNRSGGRFRKDASDRRPKEQANQDDNQNNRGQRRQQRAVTFEEGETERGESAHRGGRLGRGRGRGGRGASGAPRNRREGGGGGDEMRGKREFDRRSNRSGYRGPNDKREGGGAHNWGSVRDETKIRHPDVELEPVENEQEPAEPKESESGETANETEATSPEEQEPKEMTLDEYKASQEKFRFRASLQTRQIVKDESADKWAKIPLTKGPDGQSRSLSDSDRSHKSGRTKEAVNDIAVRFYESAHRGGRGQGGDRGGRGGGGDRGGRDGRGGGGERGGRGGGGDRGGRGGGDSRWGDRGGGGGGDRGGRGRDRGRGSGGQGRVSRSAPDFGSKEDFPELGGADHPNGGQAAKME